MRLRQPDRDGRFTHLHLRNDVLRCHQQAIERDAERADHDPRRAFGARLRELRVARDLTHHELARLALVKWTMLGRIEQGHRNVGVDLIERLAAGFDVCIDFFIWRILYLVWPRRRVSEP